MNKKTKTPLYPLPEERGLAVGLVKKMRKTIKRNPKLNHNRGVARH